MQTSATNPSGVRHDEAAHRFEISVDSDRAHLDHEWRDGTMVITHTFVPGELRGRGLAEQLARAALEWARGRGVRVAPACSYVARFIERHAEYQALVG